MPQANLVYLQKQLTLPGESFFGMWGKLSDKDKDELKAYAEEEQRVLKL